MHMRVTQNECRPRRTCRMTSKALCRLYTLRADTHDSDSGFFRSGSVQFSLPAKCFLVSLGGKHRLDLHVSAEGHLVGLQWRLPKFINCDASPGLAVWPPQSPAKLVLPVPGLDISSYALMGLDGAP
jgi:hypothetical protein